MTGLLFCRPSRIKPKSLDSVTALTLSMLDKYTNTQMKTFLGSMVNLSAYNFDRSNKLCIHFFAEWKFRASNLTRQEYFSLWAHYGRIKAWSQLIMDSRNSRSGRKHSFRVKIQSKKIFMIV